MGWLERLRTTESDQDAGELDSVAPGASPFERTAGENSPRTIVRPFSGAQDEVVHVPLQVEGTAWGQDETRDGSPLQDCDDLPDDVHSNASEPTENIWSSVDPTPNAITPFGTHVAKLPPNFIAEAVLNEAFDRLAPGRSQAKSEQSPARLPNATQSLLEKAGGPTAEDPAAPVPFILTPRRRSSVLNILGLMQSTVTPSSEGMASHTPGGTTVAEDAVRGEGLSSVGSARFMTPRRRSSVTAMIQHVLGAEPSGDAVENGMPRPSLTPKRRQSVSDLILGARGRMSSASNLTPRQDNAAGLSALMLDLFGFVRSENNEPLTAEQEGIRKQLQKNGWPSKDVVQLEELQAQIRGFQARMRLQRGNVSIHSAGTIVQNWSNPAKVQSMVGIEYIEYIGRQSNLNTIQLSAVFKKKRLGGAAAVSEIARSLPLALQPSNRLMLWGARSGARSNEVLLPRPVESAAEIEEKAANAAAVSEARARAREAVHDTLKSHVGTSAAANRAAVDGTTNTPKGKAVAESLGEDLALMQEYDAGYVDAGSESDSLPTDSPSALGHLREWDGDGPRYPDFDPSAL